MKNRYKIIISIICIVTFLGSGMGMAQVSSPIASAPEPIFNSNIKISMDFEDADLNDVLKIFSQQSGLNFIASDEIKGKKVTLYLDSVSVQDALNSIINAHNLTYEQPAGSNIFIMRDLGISSVKVITRVYYLKYARVNSSRLSQEISNRLGSSDTSESGSSDSGDTSASGSSSDSGRDVLSMVSKVITTHGKISEDARTNSLIVTDVPAQFSLIEEVISAIDVSVPQVLLEVEMLDVSKELLDKIGIKYPQTAIQYGGASLNNVQFQTSWPVPSQFADALSGVNPYTRIAQAAKFEIFGGGISVDMLTTDTRTRFLARPRIFTLSNETAEIRISQDEAIGGAQSTSGSGATTVTEGTAERTETGVILRVTPQVDEEGGLITLYVEPRVTKTGSEVSFTIAGSTTQFKNPETRQTKSVIRLKDGETIVLGGLIRTDKKTVITKIPLLGDLPFIGKLFTHTDDQDAEERELVVFITPHIVKDMPAQAVSQVREQTIPFDSYIKEQAEGVDRRRNIDQALDKASVDYAMPK